MKKLMIAAAAAAMVGGAYATEGCAGCNTNVKVQEATAIEVTVNPCAVTAYNVKFNLKTLVSKGVKTGDCQGYCMEQGNRTLEGILWSCCTQCENWGNDPDMTNVGGEEEPFQYTLWEKNGKRCFTGGMVHANAVAASTSDVLTYTYTAQYNVYAGTLRIASGFDFDTANDAEIAFQKLKDAGTYNNSGYCHVDVYQEVIAATEVKTGYKFAWVEAADPTKFKVVDSGLAYTSAADAANAFNALNAPNGYLADKYAVNADGTLGGAGVTFAAAEYDSNDKTKYSWCAHWDRLFYKGTGSSEAAAKAAAKPVNTYMTVAEIKAYNAATGAGLDESALDAGLIVSTEAYTSAKTGESTTDATVAKYYDTDASIQVYRFSKKANKAEALWTIDTVAEGVDNGFKSADAEVYLVAAGFGTTTTDGDEIVVSSLSGNCAGKITPAEISADCAGSICDMCEDFYTWCTDGFTATYDTTFVSGTWTMKYIKKLSKGFEGVVPSYAGIDYL